MNPRSQIPGRKRRWRWWTVVLVNVAGLLLIVPLLRVAVPLMGVWWHTRSQESLRQHELELHRAQPSRASRGEEKGGSGVTATPAKAESDARTLTNQLGRLQNVSDSDLQSIVAQQFGVSARKSPDSGGFDMDSAVFDSISKTTLVRNGTTYYGYEINLVDQNGRHKTNIDCYTEPNLDYERSMATMQLINNSPQLQRIYRAMAGSLAEKAASSTNSTSDGSSAGPVLRLEPGSGSK